MSVEKRIEVCDMLTKNMEKAMIKMTSGPGAITVDQVADAMVAVAAGVSGLAMTLKNQYEQEQS
jgi:hypothetical protein